MQVVKRDGRLVPFDPHKIEDAILKAMKRSSGKTKSKIAVDIANEIFEENKDKDKLPITEIENMVYNKLISKKQKLTAKSYEGYRSIREFQRNASSTIDKDIRELLDHSSDYWMNENSNKNPMVLTTQRDYMAGIVSTDLTKRFLLPPDVVEAHEEGVIHFHKRIVA